MRDKFTSRSILLRSQQQVDTLLNLIPNLPLDPDKPIECLIREQVKQRGLDQNGLYWLRLADIAEQGWVKPEKNVMSRQYTKDIWHIYSGIHIMPDEVELKDGSKCSKWVGLPDGSQAVISTSMLSKRCFAEYTELVEVFGSELGVHFRARDYA